MVEKEIKKTEKKSKKKVLIAILCIFLALIIALFAVGFSYWKKITQAPPPVEDTMVYDFDEEETIPESLEDDPIFEEMYEGNATEFKAAVKEWACNGGEIMYSKDVINVLCVGVDTRNKNTISGLSDSMILCSVNTERGEITFTSIMRDSYAYLQSPDGDGSFNKINAAFPFYGVDNLVETIQNHFKVRIDGYAMINFALFKAVIDKFDGVTVNVKEYEADYINSTYDFNVQPGVTVLNGDEALAFCRSRKCDSDGDVSRTRRQRQVLLGLLNKATTIKASEVAGYVETMMPYLKTNYTETEVLTLGTKAVVGNWADFKVNQLLLPDENSRRAHSGDVWYWQVDYPLAAQTLQKQIYGESNIVLEEGRISPLDM